MQQAWRARDAGKHGGEAWTGPPVRAAGTGTGIADLQQARASVRTPCAGAEKKMYTYGVGLRWVRRGLASGVSWVYMKIKKRTRTAWASHVSLLVDDAMQRPRTRTLGRPTYVSLYIKYY
jgi:hypothetical protein